MSFVDTSLRITTVGDFAEDLSGRRLVAFAGAGISYGSGLPLVADLTRYILRRLNMSGRDSTALESRGVPFELFVQALAEVSDAEPLFEMFGDGEPCGFHLLCAQLAARGLLTAIVTTNFDLCFEAALAGSGLPYTCVWSEAELASWAPAAKPVPIVKIHGSAHDIASLGITIRRVAHQRGVAAREAALRKALTDPASEMTIVVGYSGSDRFDVNPALERLAGAERPIVLVAHTTDLGTSVRISPLRGHPRSGPFAALNGNLAECDTDLLIEALSVGATIRPVRQSGRWMKFVDRWLSVGRQRHGQAFRHLAKGSLLRSAALPKAALIHFRRAAPLAPTAGGRAEILLTEAKCHRDIGNTADAKRIAVAVLKAARRLSSATLETAALIELGVLAGDQGRFDRALRYYRSAEALAWKIGSPHLAGICIGNSAIIRKSLGGTRRWRRALRDYDRALDIARDEGDKRSEGRTLGNKGVLYSRMGDSERAIAHFRAAGDVAASLGDNYHRAIWLANEGDQVWNDDPVRAKSLVHEAREMFRRLGSTARVSDCEEMLKRFASGAPSRL